MRNRLRCQLAGGGGRENEFVGAKCRFRSIVVGPQGLDNSSEYMPFLFKAQSRRDRSCDPGFEKWEADQPSLLIFNPVQIPTGQRQLHYDQVL